jgi:hypothetical protein
MDDGAQIEIRGDSVGEILDNDDGPSMESTGADSMSLSE